MRYLTVAAIALAIALLGLVAPPAQAAGGCWVSPDSSAEVGTTFSISCDGYMPNVWGNIYAVEPDGRASGINIYGFFPASFKANENGSVTFDFVTEFDGFAGVPIGHYTFVVQQLALGGATYNEQHVSIDVQSRAESNNTAELTNTVDGRDVMFWGRGFDAFEQANVWVSQPDGAKCSGLGIDQLSLGTLRGDGSSLWAGPGTVKADAYGEIAFSIHFRESACIGEYFVTVRGPSTWTAAETSFVINGNSVTESGDAWLKVSDMVPAYQSLVDISGGGYHPNEILNCWFTRPDGRVLSFINVDPKTDASGSFHVQAALDDFPPYTSTEPGTWHVTCATPDRAHLNIATFTVYGLESAP